MNALIFYGSYRKISNAHKLVTGNKQPCYYVRTEFKRNMDNVTALSNAKPLPDETLLNTVDCP